MNRSNQSVAMSSEKSRFRFCLPLLAMLLSGNVLGDPARYQDINLELDIFNELTDCPTDPDTETEIVKFAAMAGNPLTCEGLSSGCDIAIVNSFQPNVTWKFEYIDGDNDCSYISFPPTCSGMSVNLPDLPGPPDPVSGPGSWTTESVPRENLTTLTDPTGGALPEIGITDFYLTARTDPDNGKPCKQRYRFHVTVDGGGWGDPHITTVDGINYDFQSAGEFVALKGGGIEIQTRQTPVSTQNPANHKYNQEATGLRNCVSLYTAVAAKVGDHRVTIQPNISGVPDPAGLQIRVDGVLRTLGPDGIDLSSCDCPSTKIKSDGRIVRSADDESIEIHYANGTRLLVTPKWWGAQQKWYLNVNVYDTTATRGIMGLTKDNWLPALANGTSVGERAGNSDDLYKQLYEDFADSWRVGSEDNTSLFDYAPGTSTVDFTLDEWPRKEPANCLIEDEPVAEPVDEAVAEAACSEVVDENNRKNCIFDVRVTGHTGFAEAYERSEQIIPGATRTSLVQDKSTSKPGETVTFTARVQRAVSTIGKITSGAVQFVDNGNNVGSPKEFDANGTAIWTTSSLASGSHDVEARFLPSGFGERFRTSRSTVTHRVGTDRDKWWVSFHVGTTAPTGNLSDNYDQGNSIMLDLEYKITPVYSFLGLLGYNNFKGTSTGIDDTKLTNLSANIKYYYYRFADIGRVWVNAGAGAYKPETGSTRAGANIGVSLEGNINPQLRWQAGVNYHNAGSDTQFTLPTVGVTYNF